MKAARRVDWTNVLMGVLLVWFGVTCSGCFASSGRYEQGVNTIEVVVSSRDYDTDAVFVMCDTGARLTEFRNVSVGVVRRETVRVHGCRRIEIAAEQTGRGRLSYEYPVDIVPGELVRIIIMPSMAGDRPNVEVYVEANPAPPDHERRIAEADADTAIVLIRPRQIELTMLHAAVWDMTERCLRSAGYEPPVHPASVAWLIADSIVGDPSGVMPWGVSGPGSTGYSIVVSTGSALNPAIISHEIIHVQGVRGEDDPLFVLCTVKLGVDLPLRWVEQSELPGIRLRGLVIPTGGEGADEDHRPERRPTRGLDTGPAAPERGKAR